MYLLLHFLNAYEIYLFSQDVTVSRFEWIENCMFVALRKNCVDSVFIIYGKLRSEILNIFNSKTIANAKKKNPLIILTMCFSEQEIVLYIL